MKYRGFFWTVDSDGQVIIVFPSSQLSAFGEFQNSLTSTDYLVEANGQKGPVALAHLYQHAYAGEPITYTVQQENQEVDFILPATTFTWDMWWQISGTQWSAYRYMDWRSLQASVGLWSASYCSPPHQDGLEPLKV